ncbi:DUF4160 domain-containing protein [Adhaeretor mobilis]|uniref:DUF4160 domain-containing protein n=1 Tax=Adhaeretor mobilis TaxID=1930276 RepID=UPI0011A0CB43|nr:DUF4160 domain-containing protein [Adhaeretor mobilis]
MPTILKVRGWRVFFYSEEGNEPIHVHATKADCECKIWLKPEAFDIDFAWSHGLKPQLRREVRKIVFENFELIVEQWNRHIEDSRDANH